MDTALRTLELRARAAPGDAGPLRALIAARARAGDARGEWRARAALARVTGEVQDWRALEPVARAPSAPARVRAWGRQGPVIDVRPEGLTLATDHGLVVTDLEGRALATVGSGAVVATRCGPDVLVATREALWLVDARGAVVTRASLEPSPRQDRPAGYVRDLQVTGDRAVVWRWTREAQPVRCVLDVGEDFGAPLAQVTLAPRAWGAEGWPGPRRGRLVHDGGWPAWGLSVGPLGAASRAWTHAGERLAGVDARGVVARAGGELVERDLLTGERRWSAPVPASPYVGIYVALSPEVAVLGHQDPADLDATRLDAHERERGTVAWSARVRGMHGWLVAGDDLVTLHHEEDGRTWLEVRALAHGRARWSVELARLSAARDLSPPTELVAGDGVLAASAFTPDGVSTLVVTER